MSRDYGSLGTLDFADWALRRTRYGQSRAVLLVDHNVKGAAALVDRVLAMYLGEKIAQGSADEVMRDETVRRVYLGGKLETHARPEIAQRCGTPLLEVKDLRVLYGKAQALEGVSLHVYEGEFVSVVGLNGAGKNALFNAISGLLPYSGEISFRGEALRGRSAAKIAAAASCNARKPASCLATCQCGRTSISAVSGCRSRSAKTDWLFGLFPILQERRTQPARTLSGGEQQMLAIARGARADRLGGRPEAVRA
jgi:branched-chain amino acid transport system ATP-binding protein